MCCRQHLGRTLASAPLAVCQSGPNLSEAFASNLYSILTVTSGSTLIIRQGRSLPFTCRWVEMLLSVLASSLFSFFLTWRFGLAMDILVSFVSSADWKEKCG